MKTSRISANHLKELSKLKLKKYRDETNHFLIESEKILKEALNSEWIVKEIYITSKHLESINRLENLIKNRELKIFELNEKEFAKISSEKTPSGIGALVEKKIFGFNFLNKENPDFILALEEISDPGNLGTVIRSADWFGIKFIVLSKNSVEQTNPKVIKASMGSIFHLNVVEEVELPDFIKKFQSSGYKIISTSTKGEPINRVQLSPKSILVFGNESRGISEEILKLSNQIIGIPSAGKAESLNLAISTSIILYELWRMKNS